MTINSLPEVSGASVAVTPYNPQLQRTVIRQHVRAASATQLLCARGAQDAASRGR